MAGFAPVGALPVGALPGASSPPSSVSIVDFALSPQTNTAAEVTFGSAPQDGDLLVAMGIWWTGHSPASGWTMEMDTGAAKSGVALYYKYCGSGESATQSPFASPSTNDIACAMWNIRGATGSWATDKVQGFAQTDVFGANDFSEGFTTLGDNSIILGIMGGDVSTSTTVEAPFLTLSGGASTDGTWARSGVSTNPSFAALRDFQATSGTAVEYEASWATNTQQSEFWMLLELKGSGSGTDVVVTPGAGTFTYTGSPLTYGFGVNPGAGVLAYTGLSVTLGAELFAGNSQAYIYTGSPATATVPAPLRVSQFGLNSLVIGTGNVYATQFGLNVHGINTVDVRIDQFGAQVLAENTIKVRITQMGLLVLAKGGTVTPTPAPLSLLSSGRSKIVNQRFVNMYYEPTPDGPASDARFPRPGLVVAANRGGGPVKAMFKWQGFLFTVSGVTVWRDAEAIGQIADGPNVRFAYSETEIVLVSGGNAYYVTTTDVAPMTDPDIPDPVIDTLYAAGRFLYLSNSGLWYWSDVGDARTVDPLSFATAEYAPDNLVGAITLQDNFALAGTDSFEFWYGTGDDDSPFTRSNGRVYDKGLAAIETLKSADNSAYFLGSDRIVYRMDAEPMRVSNFDVEDKIRRVKDEDLPSSWAFSIVFGGHTFYVLSLPGQGTWAFDISQNKWSEWKTWGQPNFRVRCAVDFFMGDQYGGNVLQFDADVNNDVGDPLERIVGVYLPFKSGTLRQSNLMLGTIRGVGKATGVTDPVVEMRYSDTEGAFWTNWQTAPLGKMGEYDDGAKAIWSQLGSIKPPGRLFEFRCTDDVNFTPYVVKYNEQRP